MEKIKTQVLTLLLLIFISTSIFAISPVGTVTAIGQSSQIGNNIFPISSYITYDVFDFKFIEGYPTNMTFDIKGGYGTRGLNQDPISGLVNWCDSYESDAPGDYLESGETSYGIIFSGWQTKFTQPLPISQDIPGNIRVWLGASGHYEQAIDKLENYRNQDPYTSTIFDQLDIDFDSTFYGVPDLTGNRYIHDFSFNLGSIYSHSIKEIPYSFSITANLAPKWLLNDLDTFDGHTNYFQITPNFYASKTLYLKTYKDIFTDQELNLWQIVLSNSLTYRYLNGTAVPQYRVSADNLHHDISNSFALNIYGPQFIAADCYPNLTLSYNSDFRWGKLNNTAPQYNEYKKGEFTHSLNLRFDLRIIGIIHGGYTFALDLLDFSTSKGAYFYVQL